MIRFPAFLLSALIFSGAAWAQTVVPAPVLETQAQTTAPSVTPPVVLELFTSQGCSFCPPADKLLGQIAGQPGVIALSCHVDYFGVRENSLGQQFCTTRQNTYNRLIGTGPRYTPQLVVNGHMDMIGYEGAKVSAAILRGRGEKLFALDLKHDGNGTYHYRMPAVFSNNQPLRLWLAIYDAPKELIINEGGNFGKQVTYTNVVSRLSDLGAWDGKAQERSVTPNYIPANAGIAVIVQNAATGRIIGAGAANR